VWSAERIPTAVNFSFLDRSRYFCIQIAPQLSSRGWVDPVPDPLLLKKSGSAGNRTRDLWICSQELWTLYHRGILIYSNMDHNYICQIWPQIFLLFPYLQFLISYLKLQIFNVSIVINVKWKVKIVFVLPSRYLTFLILTQQMLYISLRFVITQNSRIKPYAYEGKWSYCFPSSVYTSAC
jgi:hypothetical protein